MTKETPISRLREEEDLGGFLKEILEAIKDIKTWQSRFNNQLQLLLEEIRGENTERDADLETMEDDE